MGNSSASRNIPIIPNCKFEPKEIELLHLTWQDLADRSDGRGIDKDTFLQYFPLNGLLGERLFVQFDTHHTGYVDFEEFIRGISRVRRSTEEDKLHFVFNIFTTSNNDVITTQDLTTLLNHFPKNTFNDYRSSHKLTSTNEENDGLDRWTNHDVVAKAFDATNAKQSGQLRFDEFKLWVDANPTVVDYIVSSLPFRDVSSVKNRSASVESELAQRGVIKQGDLFKKGQKTEWMIARHFVVAGNCMYYYASKYAARPKGVIFLTGCLIESIHDSDLADKGYYGFELLHRDMSFRNPEHHKHQQRKLFCRSQSTRDNWVTLLQHAADVIPLEDDYNVGDKIGAGMFSIVHDCTHKMTKKKFAVKIMKKDTMSKEVKALLHNEITILKMVNHPNIIHLEGVYENKHNISLVMEKLSGGELFDRIVGHPKFTDTDAAVLMKHLLESVAYLHDLGIVHRDLKPENILCGDNFEDIKIADFGLSKMTLPNEKMDAAYGTLSYVAPEVLTMTGYGEETDLWSLGVIMFLILYGRLPFDGADDDETRRRIKEANFKPNPITWDKMSEESKSLISALLTRDPSKRITARDALKHPFILRFFHKETSSVVKSLHSEAIIEELQMSDNLSNKQTDSVEDSKSIPVVAPLSDLESSGPVLNFESTSIESSYSTEPVNLQDNIVSVESRNDVATNNLPDLALRSVSQDAKTELNLEPSVHSHTDNYVLADVKVQTFRDV